MSNWFETTYGNEKIGINVAEIIAYQEIPAKEEHGTPQVRFILRGGGELVTHPMPAAAILDRFVALQPR